VVKAWSLAGGNIDTWFDHKGYELINGLIHWWIYDWMDYWEVVETVEGGA
jgi:hypothetical protein